MVAEATDKLWLVYAVVSGCILYTVYWVLRKGK